MEPLRDQIVAVIVGRIADGTYPTGRRIPSIRSMADQFGVSTNTVEAAVKQLRERGLVQGVHGRGTFVIAKPDASTDGD